MMRNKYDRFHAESKFNLIKSDEFLATYIEESIKGLADFVIVPNEKNVNPDAFLTANYLKKDWEIIGENISKMVLSAVSSETCKGWYIKLISESRDLIIEVMITLICKLVAVTNSIFFLKFTSYLKNK